VQGADDYFRLDVPSTETVGTVQIPINVPEDVDTGSASFYTCVQGSGGGVSNAVNTPISITNTSSSGGGGGSGTDSGTNWNGTPVSSSCYDAIQQAKSTLAAQGGSGGGGCVDGCVNTALNCYAATDCADTNCISGGAYTNCIVGCF
jgi:hypothetical protein